MWGKRPYYYLTFSQQVLISTLHHGAPARVELLSFRVWPAPPVHAQKPGLSFKRGNVSLSHWKRFQSARLQKDIAPGLKCFKQVFLDGKQTRASKLDILHASRRGLAQTYFGRTLEKSRRVSHSMMKINTE
jgi:hypothetical protein